MTLNKRDDLGIWRSIPIEKLREIVDGLSVETSRTRHVVVNAVENLSIFDGEIGDEENWKWVGYVDLSAEEFCENVLDEDQPINSIEVFEQFANSPQSPRGEVK